MNVTEQPALLRHRLQPRLVDHVVVGGLERVRVAEVDLVLAGPRLALRRLDAHAGGRHRVAHVAEEGLVVAGGEDVVVEDVRHRGRQIAVVLRVRLLVALLEEIELELRAEIDVVAERRRPRHLRLQHLPRRGADRRAVVPDDVAEDERGRLVPRDPAQRRRGRAGGRSRRSRAPSSRSRSRAPDPSPSRARAGSCSPRPRARRRAPRGRTRPAAACPSADPACR